jgi:large subunit ribosomal protein L7/L12
MTEETKTASTPAEIPAKFKTLIESVEKMSVLELNELVKAIENRFGVSASAVAAAPAAVAAPAGEEKTSFNVIKAIKDALAIGLSEAKGFVDSAPKVIKENMKKEDAEALKKAIETAGGKVELK